MPTIRVPEDFVQIQDAIAAATGADIIDIAAGTYNPALLVGWAGKDGLVMRGRTGNPADVIIQPFGGQVATIQDAPGITWRYLTARVTGEVRLVYVFRSDRFRVEDCVLEGVPVANFTALVLIEGQAAFSADDCAIIRSTVRLTTVGSQSLVVYVTSNADNFLVEDSFLEGGRYGVFAEFSSAATPLGLTARRTSFRRHSVAGLAVEGVRNTIVDRCVIRNSNLGVWLADGIAVPDCQGSSVRSSVLETTQSALVVGGGTRAAFEAVPWAMSDYNTLRNAGGALIGWGATNYGTLAAWQAAPPAQDAGSSNLPPLLRDPDGATPDLHERSRYGRWDSASAQWVYDVETSPCVDGGDPAIAVGSELAGSNGGRLNRGVYGGTAEASLSDYPVTTTPCDEEVVFGSRRFGTFRWGDTERFVACDKIEQRVPEYVVRNALLEQLEGAVAKQIEIHRRHLQALRGSRRLPGLIESYAAEWGMFLRGTESVPEILALLAKRDTIVGARGTVAHPTDPDAGIRGELDRVTAAPGENTVLELSRFNTGWWLAELKSTARQTIPMVNATFPGTNRWGLFSRVDNYVWLGVRGILIVVARNRNSRYWSAAEIEALIVRHLIPLDVSAVVTVVEVA